MRLTANEYCNYFKISKEVLNSKIKANKLDYIIEDDQIYILVTKNSLDEKNDNNYEKEKVVLKQINQIIRPKTTVATVLALYQKENNFLKSKVAQLEVKIDKLIDDKEQMLRAERDKIEQIYSLKDAQLKNILELVERKMTLEREQTTIHEIESFNHQDETKSSLNLKTVELKEYLKSLNLKSFQKKIIKKRFLNAYNNDIRVIHKDGKLYLDFSKYDYSDLLAY
ncbi:hypothetical protein CVO_07245 [Sulfurimonas sp. CVO]|uniref:hypothetical protein n=1 Tax=Sulfurimonas sp. CVO TaxID=2283483 RepID=UPI00132F1355|nr:hypothetical protein [Sulfurimonas sp. CVO]QHG91635.1 hypothetical protein CVO_07245 [Sulfurimonas sp. CVO]